MKLPGLPEGQLPPQVKLQLPLFAYTVKLEPDAIEKAIKVGVPGIVGINIIRYGGTF
jgi:hypothetical protein